MRVMYLSATGELGGAERLLLDLLAGVRRARPSWPLHLVAPGDGPLAARASLLGITSTVLAVPASFVKVGEAGGGSDVRLAARLALAGIPIAAFTARLRHVVAAFRPDVLHTNSLKVHVPGTWTSGRAAVIWHLHDYVASRPLTARLLRWNAGRCAAAIVPSHSVADDARRVVGNRIHPVLNGVDLEQFSDTGVRLDLDGAAGLSPARPDVVRVGLLGAFAKWKGHTTFLDALARLPATAPVRGYVIGGPLYKTPGSQYSLDDLRTHASRLGLDGRVGFTGFVERPDAAIRSLDIVVHASTEREPFGLVIAEAMACGRAVIASDTGGAAELYTPAVDALAHTAGSAEHLASQIALLADDPALRRRLGAAARHTAEHRFDRRRMASEIVTLYEDVAGQS
jgi:glycosyltransferase involved in cell wall biosynthesis